jgi:cell division septation protein DedD
MSHDENNNPSREKHPFAGYDEDHDYEEPDRDTDYATVYADFDEDDEEVGYREELEEDVEPETDEPEQEPSPWSSSDDPDEESSVWTSSDEPEEDSSLWARDEEPTEVEPEADLVPASAPEREYEWQDEDYPEEEDFVAQKFPLGMIVVGVVALILLIAGGYGVIQQRSALEEEILQLRADLATTASPEEVASSRAALREAERRNNELVVALQAVTLDRERLTDTVRGLEKQLQAQQEALARQPVESTPTAAPAEPAPVRAEPKPKPAPTNKPAPEPERAAAKPKAAPAASTGDWFVNFGSYAQRDTADSWASRLSPDAGKVVVSTGTKGDRTFYRVRVVGLTDREQAEAVARSLEREFKLSKLWVGRQ